MKPALPFYKMAASGNDFVVIDNRARRVSNLPALTQAVCDRHRGVGADGVLLLEPSKKGDYKMRILNADGSEAEACGNGFRCIALFAKEKLGLPNRQQFESLSGMIQAEVKGKRVRVRLAAPSRPAGPEKIKVFDRQIHYYFVNTGVPHIVVFVEGIEKIPVFDLGKELRFHSQFRPAGPNVNFVEVTGPRALSVRTYERGVEQETLACGTGSAASAVVSAHLKYVKPPVEVKTSGGEILTIDFAKKGDRIREIFLEGEAAFVFEGKWMGRNR